MKKFVVLLLALAMMLAMVACGEKKTDMVYAVEAGSAGEAAAQEQGRNINSVGTQANALMEVSAGTSDGAVIDLLMAGAMIGEGTSYPDLTYTDKLTTEEYGIGCRKGSDLADYINVVLYETYTDGTMAKLAGEHGISEDVIIAQEECSFSPAADSDVAYIQDKGVLIVGITDFAPMDYKNDNGEWTGFDAEMARIVADKLGVAIEFVEIDWDSKIMELDAKSIDVVWNGMTLTDAVLNGMGCTNAYFENAQVVVVPAK